MFQLAVNPAGRPVIVPIPVAPVVVNVMAGDKTVLMQSVGLAEAIEVVLSGVTISVPVALILPHPPVSGIV